MTETAFFHFTNFFPFFPLFKFWGRRDCTMNIPGIDDTADLGPKKNMLVLYSSTNKGRKKDATGAFIPEAEAFAKFHDVPDSQCVGINLVNIPKMAARSEVYRLIHDASYDRPLDVIAFFGHGWPDGIQFGFDREHIPELVALLSRKCSNAVKIALYACSTAENDEKDTEHGDVGPGTDGGFADELRDEMARQGLSKGWVDGHKTRGHTAWNPFCVRFYCEDTSDIDYNGEGGSWLVAPRSEFWKKWCRELKAPKGTLRYEFPLLSELAIKVKLSGLST
jgi:hypothetical protein